MIKTKIVFLVKNCDKLIVVVVVQFQQHRHLVFPWMGVTIIFLITELIATLGFSLSAIIGFIVLAGNQLSQYY